MAGKKYKGTLVNLLKAGDTITGTAASTACATNINTRLGDTYVGDTVTLIADIRSKLGTRSGQQGDISELSLAEQKLIKAVMSQMSKARATAKRAFQNPVKLHDEFRVGRDEHSAAGILSDARTVSASLKKTENVSLLTAKGWLPADTQKLDDAITAAASGLQPLVPGKADEVGQTAFLITEANDLYDRLLDIQNAADLEWPEDDPSNVAVRAKFLLGVFPYGGNGGSSTPPPTPPAPQTPGK